MTREEAAARAVAKDEDASNWDEEHAYYQNGWLGRVDTILTAADAVMFSEAAIERAAKALAALSGYVFCDGFEPEPGHYAAARAVVAALREEA